jgi:hypothetical protein
MKWLAELEPNHRQIIIEQINQTFSPGTEVPQTGSLPHYPQPEPVSASPTASSTASPLPHRGDSDSLEDDHPIIHEQSSDTEVPPTGSLPHYPQPEPVSASPIASPTASPLPHRDDSETEPAKRIDWVRYQNEAWQVSSQKNGILRLRKAGFLKVIHTVHISQVEIGGYKQ